MHKDNKIVLITILGLIAFIVVLHLFMLDKPDRFYDRSHCQDSSAQDIQTRVWC